MRANTCSFAVLAVLAVLAASPAQVRAQLEEIVVTAERREQSLQEVPLAITAFSSEMVEALRIENFTDLSAHIPGFSLSSFTKTWTNPALCGGSTSLVSAGAEQSVGLYIDDVYHGGAGDFTTGPLRCGADRSVARATRNTLRQEYHRRGHQRDHQGPEPR